MTKPPLTSWANFQYSAFDEIKWLCAFTKCTTQKFITKPQSKLMS